MVEVTSSNSECLLCKQSTRLLSSHAVEPYIKNLSDTFSKVAVIDDSEFSDLTKKESLCFSCAHQTAVAYTIRSDYILKYSEASQPNNTETACLLCRQNKTSDLVTVQSLPSSTMVQVELFFASVPSTENFVNGKICLSCLYNLTTWFDLRCIMMKLIGRPFGACLQTKQLSKSNKDSSLNETSTVSSSVSCSPETLKRKSITFTTALGLIPSSEVSRAPPTTKGVRKLRGRSRRKTFVDEPTTIDLTKEAGEKSPNRKRRRTTDWGPSSKRRRLEDEKTEQSVSVRINWLSEGKKSVPFFPRKLCYLNSLESSRFMNTSRITGRRRMKLPLKLDNKMYKQIPFVFIDAIDTFKITKETVADSPLSSECNEFSCQICDMVFDTDCEIKAHLLYHLQPEFVIINVIREDFSRIREKNEREERDNASIEQIINKYLDTPEIRQKEQERRVGLTTETQSDENNILNYSDEDMTIQIRELKKTVEANIQDQNLDFVGVDDTSDDLTVKTTVLSSKKSTNGAEYVNIPVGKNVEVVTDSVESANSEESSDTTECSILNEENNAADQLSETQNDVFESETAVADTTVCDNGIEEEQFDQSVTEAMVLEINEIIEESFSETNKALESPPSLQSAEIDVESRLAQLHRENDEEPALNLLESGDDSEDLLTSTPKVKKVRFSFDNLQPTISSVAQAVSLKGIV